MEMHKTIVISLGGSIMVPDDINTELIRSFITLVKTYTENGYRFVIITGGGKVCRRYQDALKDITTPSRQEVDWLGIYTTHLNAELLRLSFGSLAHSEIVTDISELVFNDQPIVVGAGHEPGASTDLNAVRAAKKVGASDIINLSNIDFAYDKDPRTNPDAVKIEKIGWADFRKLLPREWDPGLNAPFDPIASELAEKLGITVAIMNGNNIQNLENYLESKSFVGTVIS